MVSFSCEECGDVLTKKKLDPHRNRCRDATFTCLDCLVHFPGTEYRAHTSCITEAQKYEGKTFKNKQARAVTTAPPAVPDPEPAAMPQRAYVEDVAEDQFEDFEYVNNSDDDKSPSAPPEAPTPPAADDSHVNVFDYLVANGTPAGSAINARDGEERVPLGTELVRYDYEANAYLDHEGFMADENALVQYGTGPIPAKYQTPAPHRERRKTRDGEPKKDKKRKRLHVDVRDQVMTDAPPVLHSGLTGGLTRLMRPVFPPSPDYSGSGGDAADPSPASPLKKSRRSKSKNGRGDGIGGNLIAMMTSGHRSKSSSSTKKRKVSKKSTTTITSSSTRRASDEKAPKLIEYRPQSGDEAEKEDGGGGAEMVVYRPRADLFLSFINKGPESERGCSMNKALKRYHRERTGNPNSLGRVGEEKELWRSLRMRRNNRGEIVLFSI